MVRLMAVLALLTAPGVEGVAQAGDQFGGGELLP